MPSAGLTPIGRQLRCVLFHLCPPRSTNLPIVCQTRATTYRRPSRKPSTSRYYSYHHFQTDSRRRDDIGGTENEREAEESLPTNNDTIDHDESQWLSSEDKYVGFDDPGSELNHTYDGESGEDSSSPDAWLSTSDGHYVTRALRQLGKTAIIAESTRHRSSYDDLAPQRSQSIANDPTDSSGSLVGIIARCIVHQGQTADSTESTTFELTTSELAYLQTLGDDGVDDIRDHARILAEEDSLEAAKIIQQRLLAKGSFGVPKPVLMYVLRRQYIRPRALQVILGEYLRLVRSSNDRSSPFSERDAFIFFRMMVWHARKVWPAALPELCDLLLESIQLQGQLDPIEDLSRIDALTQRLNHALYRVVQRTSIQPFKDVDIQHAAMVKILTFMTEYDPPLIITRRGYRAVISLQLAQKKTRTDQQWAELKTLSWPPWKEARTAMDEDITVEEHGTSAAARTLQDMRRAGYAVSSWGVEDPGHVGGEVDELGFTRWDQAASTYAGWDTDRTPTIQTRSRLRSGASRSTVWAARITSTRTVQEAWACYLAYEEQHPVPHQDVLLAIFKRLDEGGKYAYHQARRANQAKGLPKLYPGDTPEVQPVPPSTHQHTYTKTTPPDFVAFYESLRTRHILLRGATLAYALKSTRLRTNRLDRRVRTFDEFAGQLPPLASLSESELAQVSVPVFSADLVATLQSRTFVGLNHMTGKGKPSYPKMSMITYDKVERSLKETHVIVYALTLLKRRGSMMGREWYAIFDALTRSKTLSRLRLAFHERPVYRDLLPDPVEWCLGGMFAYDFVNKVLSTMGEINLDLDGPSLQALCLCNENAIVGAWRLLADNRFMSKGKPLLLAETAPAVVREAAAFLCNTKVSPELEQNFWHFVGANPVVDSATSADGAEAPGVLAIPDPALLHAYIRALGWACTYKGLVVLVRWMARHSDQLAEQRARSRHGEVVMRRAIVALRTFLERRWYLDTLSPELTRSDVYAEENVDLQRRRLAIPARWQVTNQIRKLVESQDDWGGWPTDAEVEAYCLNERFRWVLGQGVHLSDKETRDLYR